MRNRCWWLVAVLAVAALAAVVSCGDREPRPLARGEAPWPSPAVSAAPVASSAAGGGFLAGDGTSLVPEQLAPGTYQSAGPVGRLACYAYVLDEKGGMTDMQAMRGPTVLVVPEGAAGAKAEHCQPFVRVR